MTSNALAYKQHRDEALARKKDATATPTPEPDVEAQRAADDSWNTWASILIGGPFLVLGFLLSTGLGVGVYQAALIGFAVGVFATAVVGVLRYSKRSDSPSAAE